jgi:hypothetical protein
MNIVEIKKEDITHVAKVLAVAFREDPIFKYIFQTEEKYDKSAVWIFSTWIRWAILFGKAWMTEDRKAVVLMRSLRSPEMSLLSMIRAGMLLTPLKLGFTSFRRFYFQVVTVLDKKHKEIMGTQPHWYGWMIGVIPEQRGAGRDLMSYCFKIADEYHLPIFLETATQRNVALYNHRHFQVRDKIEFTPGDFNLYFMVRDPQTIV